MGELAQLLPRAGLTQQQPQGNEAEGEEHSRTTVTCGDARQGRLAVGRVNGTQAVSAVDIVFVGGRAGGIAEGVGAIVYYSLASGFLSGKYRSKSDLKGRARDGAVAKCAG